MNVNTATGSHRDSGLQGFLHSLFCRAVARLLMVVLLVTGMPVDYSRPAWAAPAGAPTAEVTSPLTVGNHTLVATTRFNRTLFDFTYTATLTNAGGDAFQNVIATLTSRAAATQVIDGKLTFGKVEPGAVLRSQNTFTIRQDRTVPFNPADLVWTVSYNHAPTAEAGPDRSVPLHTPAQLDGSGSSDVDGDALTYHWTLTPPPGSNAVLSDSSAVKPTFTVDVRGNYVAQLIVRDGTTDSPADTVTLSTVNSKPVANAGPDQTVRVGAVVTLDGSGSSDVDGDKLSYAWAFISTPLESKAALQNADQVNPQFTVDKPGDYHVKLIVSDGQIGSEADIVIVSTENSPPVARAGPDQTVRVNDPVNLDGSGSSDSDGDPLTYTWALLSKPAGSSATLLDPTTVNPHFVVDKPGTYVAQLIVRDGKADSAPATVTISTENSKPTANAGPDQTVIKGGAVTLDGSGSHDADDDPLTYQWTLTTVPTGSHATLVRADTVNPTFTADRPGTYVAQLIVRDGKADSAPDTVTISTENSKPVANAGPDQTAFVNEPVTLTGAGSTDPDGDPLTFQWSLLSTPPHSTAALSGVTAPNPSFIPDLIGRYVAQLIVNDGKLNSDPATVRVDTVRRNQSPVITSAPVITATAGQPYVYDVDATDPDAGDTLTYSLNTAPQGMTIDAASGLIEWTPTEALVGDRAVTVRVTDQGGLSTEQSFTVVVTQLPRVCVPAPTGIVGWWPGDGNANDIVDRHHGMAENGTTFEPGLVGQAMYFGAPTSLIRVPNNPALALGNTFTVEFWLKPTFTMDPSTPNPRLYMFVSKGADNTINTANNTVSPSVRDARLEVRGPVPRPNSTTDTWLSGQWYHVAVTFDGSGYKVYVNGAQEGSSLSTFSILDNTNDLIFGYDGVFPHTHFDGVLDEISLYNRALTAAEIRAIFAAGSAGKCKTNIPPVNHPPAITSTPSTAQWTQLAPTGTAPTRRRPKREWLRRRQ